MTTFFKTYLRIDRSGFEYTAGADLQANGTRHKAHGKNLKIDPISPCALSLIQSTTSLNIEKE
jgi:hypothetical protein